MESFNKASRAEHHEQNILKKQSYAKINWQFFFQIVSRLYLATIMISHVIREIYVGGDVEIYSVKGCLHTSLICNLREFGNKMKRIKS